MNEKELKLRNKSLFNKLAKYYDSIFGGWLSKIQKKALSEIKIKKNSRILDVGCGTGNLLILLSKQRKNLKLYGIDISEKMLEIAKKKLGKRAELKLMAAEKLSFKQKFDYVFSFEAFHHFADQENAIKSFYRVLKKEGLLVIIDINFGYLLNRIFEKIEPGNNRMFSAEEFKNIFKAYKFRNIRQKRLGLFSIMTLGEK